MSTDTRARILEAARTLLEARGGAAVAMGEIATAAGVSRQALYLHFPDRASLFVEVARALDAGLRTAARQSRVDHAPTAREAVREAVALQAWLKPRLRPVATALDALRRTDPAAEAAWVEREEARLTRCLDLFGRVEREGALRAGWGVPEAGRMFWSLTSQRVWDDLVIHQRWTGKQYRHWLTTLVDDALLAPVS